MKLLIIRPIISEREDYLEEAIFHAFIAPDTQVTARRIAWGGSSIECEYDAAINVPDIIRLAVEGEKEGFDGAIVNCFVDPGLEAVRESVSIPVVGAGSAAVQMAMAVGKRAAIITIVPNLLAMIRRLNAEYIASGRICAVRSVDVPVLSIEGDELIYEKLYQEAVRAICEDGADSIVLGCTGFGGMAKRVQESLAAAGYPVPVIDPAGAAVTTLEGLVRNGVRQSRLSWMPPAEKKRRLH